MSATENNLYFDTSALVPNYVPEPFSTGASVISSRSCFRFVSSLAIAEFSCALRAKQLRGSISDDGRTLANSFFRKHLEETIFKQVVPVSADYEDVEEICLLTHVPIRTPDALHLAIARRLETTMVSADSRLLDVCEKMDFPYIDIREFC